MEPGSGVGRTSHSATRRPGAA